jgi:hypothetical protein
MKKSLFRRIFNLTWLIMAALLTFTACDDDDDNDDDDVIILDGIYIMGDATALDTYNTNGRFTVTKNEVNQEDRASLYEKYIAIGATGTFKIMHVAGAVKKQFGPGTDFDVVLEADRVTDDPKVDFWRGTYEENTTEFTVPADGLYHVVIDTELGKIAIMPVIWGVIGDATPGGWNSSTALTPSSFNKETMTFTKTEMELRSGQWKFRYSDGWKVVLDTIVDLGGGDKGVKVNTNFGGTAITALEAGGDNFNNTVPGVYTVTMTWTLAAGHAVTLLKTAELPLTNWTGVQVDMIGTGVSVDNTNAVVSTTWGNWGYTLLADGGAIPVVNGNLYTWTWAGVILEADSGFKIRTKDGVAPPSGGANFGVGLEAVDHANSSANVNTAITGDITVSVKTAYDVIITIDADNSDAKVITINESVK